MPSYFWQMWIFFGFFGGTIFCVVLYQYLRIHIHDQRYVSDYVFPILLFFFAGLLIGRFVVLSTWITLVLLALELNHKYVVLKVT